MTRRERLYEHQKAISQWCATMHQVGIRVDQARRVELGAQLLALAAERRQHLVEVVADPAFRAEGDGEGTPPNPHDMRALLYAECQKPGRRNFGIFCPAVGTPAGRFMRTETGAPAVSHDALLHIRAGAGPDLRAVIDAYWRVTNPLKIRSTFVRGKALDAALWADGRIHAGWNSGGSRFDSKDFERGGAATGRLTCAAPNLQNIPKADKRQGTPNVRSMYVPSPGNVLVELDYSGAELHMQAAVSHDRKLFEMLRAGDVHTLTAIAWFGLPPDTTKETCPERVRRCAKEIRFGANYRAQPPKIWTRVVRQVPDITLREVVALHRAFLVLHPDMVRWWDEEHRRVCQLGYSETRLMQRRRVYPVPPEITDTANFPIQGTVADLINCAVVDKVQAIAASYGATIVAQIHDALLLDAPRESARRLADDVAAAMRGPWPILGWGNYEFPVDATLSERWGEKC